MGFSKQCSQCSEVKWWYEFYKDRGCMFSVKAHCRVCELKNKKKYIEAHPDCNKEAKRKFKEANPDYDKNWFKNKLKNDPDYWKKRHKKIKYEHYMYKKFGLKFAESRQMRDRPLTELIKIINNIGGTR